MNQSGALDEIWVLGLRNPWRYSFDRLTGDRIAANELAERLKALTAVLQVDQYNNEPHLDAITVLGYQVTIYDAGVGVLALVTMLYVIVGGMRTRNLVEAFNLGARDERGHLRLEQLVPGQTASRAAALFIRQETVKPLQGHEVELVGALQGVHISPRYHLLFSPRNART